MPNLPTHLSLALQTSNTLANATVDKHLGSFLLGATSPDIRIMTKWTRDQTHFAPLSLKNLGAGIKGLWQTHPALANSSALNDETKVFISGYFTHLVADEAWILEIYRVHFDGDHPFPEQVKRNIWDRALQLEMDRAAREALDGMVQVRTLLEDAGSDIDVGFISADTLSRWKDWVVDFTSWDFTWDRLRFATRRMYQDDTTAMGIVEDFLKCVPSSLETVYDAIPQEKLASYQQMVAAESSRLIKEYLSEPQGD